MHVKALGVALGIAILPPLALAQDSCGSPNKSMDQWSVAAPESVGLAGATLCPIVE